ncbi:MAG: carbohydrate transporter permease [Eubacterium sp.]|jgi:multiple sugar transport system permease protein|nr:carbohydrate transporter permease [Eubacterium sp.]
MPTTTIQNTSKVVSDTKKGPRILILTALRHVILLFWAFIVLYPLSILLFTSFKTDEEYVNTSVFSLPKSFLNFGNYAKAFLEGDFITAFKNSMILVVVGAAGTVLIGAMVAFCLDRFDFKFKKYIKTLYTISYVVPSVALQVSIYAVMKGLNLTGTVYAPILIYLSTDIVQLWIYLQFMEKISVSLDESAMIEGASYLKIFTSIIFPLLAPATATIVILKSVTIYNDMYTQYLYMSKLELKTATTALMAFQGDRINVQNLMSAAIILVMVPTILIFLSMQKYIFQGITAGSVKE